MTARTPEVGSKIQNTLILAREAEIGPPASGSGVGFIMVHVMDRIRRVSGVAGRGFSAPLYFQLELRQAGTTALGWEL
jgi:hypothetical protein